MTSALSTPSIPRRAALEQDTEPPTSPRVCVHGVCVFTVCVCTLDGLKAEHKFRVWVTILDHMSRHFHI